MPAGRMYMMEERLATFKRWPYPDSAPCNARSMAEAGFYSVSTGPEDADAAKCFLCGKELDGWEETDEPRQEHRSHAAGCAFIQLDKREDELQTVEFLSLLTQYMTNEARRLTQQSKDQLETRKKHISRKVFRRHKH